MAAYVATQDGVKLPSSRIAVPKGYKSHEDFLNEMREHYDAGVSFDQHNIEAGREDARFVAGDQWDDFVENARRDAGKPVLTFNYLLKFVAQVVGNKLLNETEIKVFPDKGGTKEIAQIYEGLIRSIFKNSAADLARDEAQKYQVIGGRGVFCLVREYAANDVFEQDLKIKQVQDPYAVVADPLSIDPTWGDAKWIFVSEDVTQKEFKRRWPKAPVSDFGSSWRTWDKQGYWYQEDMVRIVSYWRMVTEGTKILGLLVDGTTKDLTEIDEFEWAYLDPPLAAYPDGSPYVREVPNTFAQLYICSGNQILEGPFNYECSSIPVYCVSGWQINDGRYINRFGLVRFLKDPMRLINYFRSVQAEGLVAAPRNKFLADPNAIKGYEKQWREMNVSDDPILPWHSDLPAPVAVQPPVIDQGLLQQGETLQQDLREISNMHEASFGQQGNEVSGVALQQRQNMADLGSMVYLDRQRLADERCAKNLIELIPGTYDTQRVVTIMGADGKTSQTVINENQFNDVTLGKYGVTVSTGPATATKRQQSLQGMLEFIKSMPETAGLVVDLLVDKMDWPGSSEIAARLRTQLPPGTVPQDELTPEQVQMQQAAAQLAEAQQQLAAAEQQAKTSKLEADAHKAMAQAQQAIAMAYKAQMDADSRRMDVESKDTERDFRTVKTLIDDHNSLEREDRDFEASREDALDIRAARDRDFAARDEEARMKRQTENGANE